MSPQRRAAFRAAAGLTLLPTGAAAGLLLHEYVQSPRLSVAEWQKPAGRRALVLGGGVVGVASAYFLSRAGFEVTLLERGTHPGQVASAASGCLLSVASNTVLASPGTLKRLAAAALGGDSWLTIQWSSLFDFELLRWGLRFAATCFAPETRKHNEDFLRKHSPHFVSLIREIAAREGFAEGYAAAQSGIMTLYEAAPGVATAASRAAAAPDDLDFLPREKLLAAEPKLAGSDVKGALLQHSDELGDCSRFTQLLAGCCRRRGVRVVCDAAVASLRMDPDSGCVSAAVMEDGREETADVFVVALGAQSPLLLRQVGVDLPVYPIKGYSLVLQDGDWGISRPLVFAERQLGFIPLGKRLRFSGVAEIAGWEDWRAVTSTVERLRADVTSLLPQAPWQPAGLAAADVRVGGRPMTPDDLPVVSGTRIPNLWINAGHCMRGWRTACGSAELLAALISGASPPDGIDSSSLSLSRFQPVLRN